MRSTCSARWITRKHVPAILLLAVKHQDWVPHAKTSECRARSATTPIKMKKLMQMIESLLPAEKR